MEEVLQVLALIAGIGAALAALTKWVIVPISKGVRRVMMFLSDWFGEEPRDGVPARPGVMARFDSLEHKVSRAEFHLGNGNPKPMRELVNEHGLQLDALKQQIDQLKAQQAAATVTPE